MDEFCLKRKIPIESGYDVVVAGGGPAGVAAAYGAGKMGKKVLLVEGMDCLGGMGTSGLVSAFGPMSDGVRQLTKGFIGEVVERMYERGWMEYGVTPDAWTKSYMRWIQYDPEGLKIIYDELMEEANVEVRFLTRVIDADAVAERVNGVVIHNVNGYRYIRAKAYIDATGDAVLADLCGAAYYEAYRDTDKGQPSTLVSIWGDINWDKAAPHACEHKKLLLEAISEGRFTVADRQFGMNRIGKNTGYLNAGHLFKVNPVDHESVSKALVWGRRQLLEYKDFLHSKLPGMESAVVLATGALLGNRESRRMIGEEQLTSEDFFAKRQFQNQIAVYNRFMDIHPYDDSLEEWERFEKFHSKYQLGVGNCLGIPYGAIVPKGWKNLWVAGRCISADNQVFGTIRSQPCCAATGQAAGCAAAQSIDCKQDAFELDVGLLQENLRAQGAYIPEIVIEGGEWEP